MRSPRPIPEAPVRTVSRITPGSIDCRNASSFEPVPVSSRPRRVTALSPRERGVLELVADGRSNKEIARLLVISPETVKSHLENLLAKLGVHRRTQAVSLAKDLGLVP